MSRGRSKLSLSWLWRAPVRALGRARDMYVRGVTGCARCVPADAAFGYPVFVPAPSLRSRSFGSGDWTTAGTGAGEEDLRELVRAASERRAADQLQDQAVARSHSMVGLSMARIDEDAPCEEFGAGGAVAVGALYTRSQSYAGGVGRADGRMAHCRRKVAALG